jgi:hypothetical protein
MTMCHLFKIQNFEVLMYFQAQFITRFKWFENFGWYLKAEFEASKHYICTNL